MNYFDSFIQLAPDSTATRGSVLPVKGDARSIPAIEHELLSQNPYFYTQEELQFAVHLQREGISKMEAKAKRQQLWTQFFNKPRACLRVHRCLKNMAGGCTSTAKGKLPWLP